MAEAAAITVIVSGAFRAAYLDLMGAYESKFGCGVNSVWGGSMGPAPTTIPSRLKRGEAAEVVILAADALDALIDHGLVQSGSRVDLARSRIGAAVRAGAPKPDISSVDAFKRTVLAAHAIAYSTSASGVYLSGLFRRLGLAEHIARIGKQAQGEPAGAIVARGEAEIAFQQVSELLPVPGIDFVAPLPEDIQQVTVFSAGIPRSATQLEAARTLIGYLASAKAADTIKNSGMDPINVAP